MNNEPFCLPGDWTCGCMDNMSDSEANFLFFGNDDGFVSTAKRPNGRNVKVWVHFKGGVPVIRLQWKGGWSEYRPAIDGNGLIKIIYDRYFDEKKESRSNIKDALFHVPNSNDLWNRVKTAMDEYVLYKNNVKINENRKMNKKQTIKLNESQLMRIVNESVKKILNENEFSESFGSIARKYGVGGERFRGRSAEDVDREKGDTTPNVIIECSPYRLTYSNKDGYVIRIEKQTGTVYCSKEPGGKSYSTTSMGAVLNGTPHNCDTLGTVREISSNNIPDKMLVSSKKSAFQIAIWMKLMICGNIQCDESLTKTSTWLAF